MFATLLGALPRPPLAGDASPDALLEAVLASQIERGIEPLSTAGWEPADASTIEAWRQASQRAGRLVKGVVVGPVTSGRAASAVRAEVQGLADAGCPWIEVREHVPDLGLATGDAARDRFRAAHEAVGDGSDGVHRSLALLGGDADSLGLEAVLGGGYASLAVDLIAGPENWRLVTALPAELGVIAGALATDRPSDLGVEVLVWAAHYAASARGRGPDRVGLATAGGLAHLGWDDAMRKLDRLVAATAAAVAPAHEAARTFDPRAVDIRSAAVGRFDPAAPKPARRPDRPSS